MLCMLLDVDLEMSDVVAAFVMWVRKQEPATEWQEFPTPAAALRHVKVEGAPSTLQQVQVERAPKNSKPRCQAATILHRYI